MRSTGQRSAVSESSSANLSLLLAVLLVSLTGFAGCTLSSSPLDGDDANSVSDQDPNIAREIEEADIVKLDDGYLYLANAYTGLRIIDVQDPVQPLDMGRFPLSGRTIELIVRDDFAIVHTSSDLYCAGEPVQFDEAFDAVLSPDYDGSRVWVIDVTDKSNPQLLVTLDGDGFVTGTRRVGDVVYLAGNTTSRQEVFITSIDIADPAGATIVESQTFQGQSLDIHLSQDAMYVLGDDPVEDETTLVTYVDITDPQGVMNIRDQFRVPGHVQNRFFVDEYEGVFRIITEEFDFNTFVTKVALYTYEVGNPDDVTRLAELPVVVDESLRAVRFDGDRGYAVTFFIVDPLFVLDLSDPQDPQITGELEVPGWSTHLVPLDDRLVGVGFDDTDGLRPALALYNVADIKNPFELSRIIVGEMGTYSAASEATVDEKALKVIPEADLILLPFSEFDIDTGEYVDSLQMVSLEPAQLQQRGSIDHRGLVRRADLMDGMVWILSDLAFQTIDIDDLEEPLPMAVIDLIDDQTLLDAGLAGCVDSARTSGTPVGPIFFEGPDAPFFFPFGILQLLLLPLQLLLMPFMPLFFL